MPKLAHILPQYRTDGRTRGRSRPHAARINAFPASHPKTPRKTSPEGDLRLNRRFPIAARAPRDPKFPGAGAHEPGTANKPTRLRDCRPPGLDRYPQAPPKNNRCTVTGASPPRCSHHPECNTERIPPASRRSARPLGPIGGNSAQPSSGEPPAAGETPTACAPTHCSHETGPMNRTACASCPQNRPRAPRRTRIPAESPRLEFYPPRPLRRHPDPAAGKPAHYPCFELRSTNQ